MNDNYARAMVNQLQSSLADMTTNKLPAKADKTYVDTQIANVASGSPKGTYATLTALQTAYPTGTTGIYVVSGDGNWYYWNGTAWTIGGTYQSTGIADGSISAKKTSFFKVSSNLFDNSKVTNGYYLDTSGNPSVNSTYAYSDYIEVDPSTEYILEYAPFAGIFYDNSKSFISSTMANPFTTPSNAKYFRMGIAVTNLSTQQMNKGNILLAYESFYERINDNKVDSNSLVDSSVTMNKMSSDVVAIINNSQNTANEASGYFKVSSNLFDSSNATPGYYLDTSGNQVAETDHSYSDYIEVEPSTDYILKYAPFAGVFYDGSKTYISGTMSNPITTPTNAKYFRFGVSNSDLSSQQMNKGDTLLAYEPFYKRLDDKLVSTESLLDSAVTVEKVASDLLSLINSNQNATSNLLSIVNDIKNPFKKTKIKLIGDSITYGAGGTGNANSGQLIGNPPLDSSTGSNVLTAVCWANMLHDFIINKFNKDHVVELSNPNLTYSASFTQFENGYSKLPFVITLTNASNTQNGIEFNFYGDHFSIFYTGKTAGGILDVLVDGVSVGQLDSYNTADNTYKLEKAITGLTLGNHSVKIVETGIKNASSTGNAVQLEALLIPKTAMVVNWGWNGATSSFLTTNKSSLIESDDDIVFMELGTNDRPSGISPSYTRAYQREGIKYMLGLNKKVILMSPPMSMVSIENSNTINYGTEDLNIVIKSLADEFKLPHVNNYQAFIDYARETGVDTDSLHADSLHPNDTGYKVMYQNIMRELGLPYLGEGMTY